MIRAAGCSNLSNAIKPHTADLKFISWYCSWYVPCLQCTKIPDSTVTSIEILMLDGISVSLIYQSPSVYQTPRPFPVKVPIPSANFPTWGNVHGNREGMKRGQQPGYSDKSIPRTLSSEPIIGETTSQEIHRKGVQ